VNGANNVSDFMFAPLAERTLTKLIREVTQKKSIAFVTQNDKLGTISNALVTFAISP
jgi:hypothetical protein